MDYLLKRMKNIENKLNAMFESSEYQSLVQINKEISEVLSDTIISLKKEKQKEAENKIESFISSRISDIRHNNTPISIESDTKAIFHLIPLSVYEQQEQEHLINITDLHHKAIQLPPFGVGSYDYRYNYDGYLTHSKNVYTQVFRNGCIESVSCRIFNIADKKIFISRFESLIVNFAKQYINVLKDIGVEGPFLIQISLIGINDYNLEVPFGYFADHYKIDKNDIILPRVKIEDNQQDKLEMSLKKSFDVLWNAGGLVGSVNYQRGEWKPKYQ